MGQFIAAAHHVSRIDLLGVEPTGRELGRGALGKICEVKHCGIVFAAKQIVVKDEDEDFRGVVLWAKLYHHNIVRFIGIQGSRELHSTVMLVMEKMDCSLWQYAQDISPIPLRNLLSILHDISLGLWYLHSCNPPVVHRNLSPHHVLINMNAGLFVAKISNFRMVAQVKPVDELHDEVDSRDDLTMAPETFDFMPPEALTHKPSYDLPLDVFSFGGVALFAASGEWPRPKDQSLVIYKISKKIEAQRRLLYLDKMIGEAAALRPLVEECLNDDPSKRPTMANVSSKIKGMKKDCIVEHSEMKPELAQILDDNGHYIWKQLQYKQRQMLEKTLDIAQKEQEIQQKDQHLNDKNQEIQQLTKEIQQKILEMQEKDKQILKNDQEILTKTLHIQQRDKEIQQKDQLLQQQHHELQRIHKEMQLKLQDKHQEIQQRDTLLKQRIKEVRIKDHQLENANKKMEEKHCQIQTFQEMEETCEGMLSQLQHAEQQIKQKERELLQKGEEIAQIDQQICTLLKEKQALQQQADSFQKPSWVLKIRDLKIKSEKLGGGKNGTVSEAIYCGCKVAVKRLHKKIESPYYLSVFRREMNMAARCRHPNLVQFIGATDEKILCIVMELMHTSLRKILNQDQLFSNQIIPISLGVAYGLNYLHLMTPDPILHRDVSSANVLLNPLPNNQWHPKLSDFGSTNFMRVSKTVAVGNPIYAAPEALAPHEHSPAMDVYSFGVLMYEMCSRKLPAQQPNQSTMNNVKWAAAEASLIDMIRSCLAFEYQKRPTMENLISRLN